VSLSQQLSKPALLPAGLEASVPTLGHAVVKWAGATDELLTGLTRGADDSGWLASRWAEFDRARPATFAAEATFRLTLAWTGDRWWIQGCSGLDIPTWNVMRWLLHLPGLKGRWTQSLRAERFERLQRCVPPLWYLDDEEPPPGSVIAGLGVGSWKTVRGALSQNAGFLPVADRWMEREMKPSATRSILYEVSAAGRVEMAD